MTVSVTASGVFSACSWLSSAGGGRSVEVGLGKFLAAGREMSAAAVKAAAAARGVREMHGRVTISLLGAAACTYLDKRKARKSIWHLTLASWKQSF